MPVGHTHSLNGPGGSDRTETGFVVSRSLSERPDLGADGHNRFLPDEPGVVLMAEKMIKFITGNNPSASWLSRNLRRWRHRCRRYQPQN
jgi:hypothetical protein